MKIHSWSCLAYLENSSAQTETLLQLLCSCFEVYKGPYLQTHTWELPGYFLKIPLQEREKEGLDSK